MEAPGGDVDAVLPGVLAGMPGLEGDPDEDDVGRPGMDGEPGLDEEGDTLGMEGELGLELEDEEEGD